LLPAWIAISTITALPLYAQATRLACYNPGITTEASRVNRVCFKTTWATLLQDYKAYKAAERGVKVLSRLLKTTCGFVTFAIPRRLLQRYSP
jgi:hypothetical protein